MIHHVFLTGANGLLGHNLTRELLQRGYRITAFVPAHESVKHLPSHPSLEIRRGNLLSYEEVESAMADCDYVIHAGANTSVLPARHPMIHKVNVDGTQHVINAALAHGVQKMVYVASANIFGYGTLEQPGDETTPYACEPFGMDYHHSKLMAYQAVQKAVQERGLPALTVCPTFMLGAYDAKPSSGSMLVALYNGKIPGFASGGRNYVHVLDVAEGIIAALESGPVGEAYILGNQNMDYKSAFQLMAGVMNIDPPKMRYPDFLIKTFGAMSSFWAFLRGKLPTISYKMSRVACAGFYYSPAKAVRELQLSQRPIEQAVADAMTWFNQNGYVSGYKNEETEASTDLQYEKASI